MVGIESGSQRILDDIYQKGIKIKNIPSFVNLARQYGVRVFAYFMIGAPTEDIGEIRKSIDLAFSLPIDEATFSITTPLPGTTLFRKTRESGYEIRDDYREMDYYNKSSFNHHLNSNILSFLQKIAFFKFYLHPRRWRMVFSSFSSIEGFRKMILKLRRFF
jgi:radical SAM superfamily enzyme YgiQ (UPF0313 family)